MSPFKKLISYVATDASASKGDLVSAHRGHYLTSLWEPKSTLQIPARFIHLRGLCYSYFKGPDINDRKYIQSFFTSHWEWMRPEHPMKHESTFSPNFRKQPGLQTSTVWVVLKPVSVFEVKEDAQLPSLLNKSSVITTAEKPIHLFLSTS